MLVIYHSYGGTAALAAAALHLGRAPAGNSAALLPAPIGSGGGPGLRLQGHDGAGHTVYTLARNVPTPVVDRAFLGVAGVFKLPATAFLLIDAGLPGESGAFWAAAALARLGRKRWARRVLATFVQRRLEAIGRIVLHTRERLATLAGAVR